MNNTTTTLENFFSECYLQYKENIRNYISYRVPHSNEAEDLMQDVFARLWEHRDFLNRDTVRSLLFTIARNIVIDRIRRYYKNEDFVSYMHNVQETNRNITEEVVHSRELAEFHNNIVNKLPSKRKRIYEMSFDEKLSCPAIAEKLCLSIRTVEGHLLLARKTVRTSLSELLYRVS